MADMRMFLGTPYERGNSDSIVSRQIPEGVGEGLIVSSTGDNTADLSGGVAYGVTGKREIGAMDVVTSGLKVYVQTDLATGSAVTIGSAASYDAATGKIVNTGGTGINAVLRSGVVECKDSRGNSFNGIAIDFVGGL